MYTTNSTLIADRVTFSYNSRTRKCY